MTSLATSAAHSTLPQTDAVTPVFPRSPGRPSGYSEETVGRICEVIRRRGLADAAAAQTLGISRVTLWRWKQDHPELEEWLAMAREQYREAKLAIVDEAKTADGRPDWRAAAWALAKAFPEDYGRGAGRAASAPAQARPRAEFSTASFLEEEQREVEEYLRANLTPEIREFIQQENEETERLEREAARLGTGTENVHGRHGRHGRHGCGGSAPSATAAKSVVTALGGGFEDEDVRISPTLPKKPCNSVS